MIKVCVLMSTYNGEKYIEEQIESILKQKDVNVKLIVRDDGSSDKTIEILKKYESAKKLSWYSGENLKPALSFMHLLANSPKCDFYAFADQDDYWDENKLISAVKILSSSKGKNGKLYMSALNVADKELKIMYKTSFPKKIDIKNEMIKNYATGCTMVLDNVLKEIVCDVNYNYIAMHDSFIHRIALISDSYIYYDNHSHILYRQHDNNVLGMTNNFYGKWLIRYKHFVNSECIASKTANEFLNSNLKISEHDKEFLSLLAGYKHNLKNKIKFLFMHIFGMDEFLNSVLLKVKILFNKV